LSLSVPLDKSRGYIAWVSVDRFPGRHDVRTLDKHTATDAKRIAGLRATPGENLQATFFV
jgi:hypothetical protein